MKQKTAKELLKLSDSCPKCKKKGMEIACDDVWSDGGKVYFIKCKYCGYEYED